MGRSMARTPSTVKITETRKRELNAWRVRVRALGQGLVASIHWEIMKEELKAG